MQNLDIFTVDELLALAEIDLEKKMLADSLHKLKHLSLQGVVNDELDAMLGSVYAKLKLFTSAAQHYSQLLERNDTRLHEQFQLGMVNYEMGNNDIALKCWDKVLEVEPSYPPVLFHKAILMLELEDVITAKKLLDFLLEVVDKTNYYAEQANTILEELATLAINSENKPALETH